MAKPASVNPAASDPASRFRGGRRLTATRPQDASLRPEAETVEAQVKGVGVHRGGNLFEPDQPRRGHRSDKGQGQMQ